jgi:hypothetical protein
MSTEERQLGKLDIHQAFPWLSCKTELFSLQTHQWVTDLLQNRPHPNDTVLHEVAADPKLFTKQLPMAPYDCPSTGRMLRAYSIRGLRLAGQQVDGYA